MKLKAWASVLSVKQTDGDEVMTRTAIALASAAALAGAAFAPAPAQARGGAIAAGIIGGLAAGALIAGAANAAPYYGRPAYYAGPPCFWRRERFWDGYGWRVQRVRVCR
jgi:hypothetical protein